MGVETTRGGVEENPEKGGLEHQAAHRRRKTERKTNSGIWAGFARRARKEKDREKDMGGIFESRPSKQN